MLNKKHIILLAFLLGFSMLILSPAYSGTQSTWIHEYDGYYNDYPFILYALQQTIEGGYILAGSRDAWCDPCPSSWESFLIIKVDIQGNIVWEKIYGYGSTDGEYASSIQQTADRGYIVAGLTTSSGAGNDDIWILKLDSSGNIIWQKTYGREGDDTPYSIHQTSDGGYVVAASTCSLEGQCNIWILKLNAFGNVIWQKMYGPQAYTFADVQQATDGGYIVAGSTSSFGAGQSDFLILKLNPSGGITWQKTYGGAYDEEAFSIQQTADGNYVVAGSTDLLSPGSALLWILNLDTSGNIIWQKAYDYFSSAFISSTIQQTLDGGYVAAGNGFGDWQLFKVDSSGNIIAVSCNIIQSTSVVPSDSYATIANASISVSSPIFSVSNTSMTADDYYAIDYFPCQCFSPHGCMGITTEDLDASADSGVQICWKQDPGDNPANWGDNSYGTRTYDMLRDGSAIASSIPYGTTCFIDTTGTNSLTYAYAVRYNNGCGFSTISPSVKASDYIPALISQKPVIVDFGNGIIEPNENITLRGALRNATASTATSVIGHLTSVSPIVIGNAHATYPDINSGDTENCLTCYSIMAPAANRPSMHWDIEVIETPDCAECSRVDYNFLYHVGNSFTDVNPSQIFYPYIEKLLHSGATGGCTSTTFCPSATVRRDNMAKFICLSMQAENPCSCIVSDCKGYFEDLPQSNVFCPYIEALYDAGVIAGCSVSPNLLCPSLPIIRSQMAKFVCNAMDAAIPGSCALSPCTGIFQDVPASNVFCGYIEGLYTAGVVNGCQESPKLYCPNSSVQRDQMSKYLVLAFSLSF